MIGEFSTPAVNGQVIARLYDVNETEGGVQQLIGRAIYRPINPAGGFTKQVFQIHPQAWNVAAGHVVKLELLAQDSTYARNSSTPQSIKVKNLELRLPTIEPPGSDGGLVQSPLPKYLPPGYMLALGNYTQVITGTVHGPLVVKAGQVVELASTGKISGPVTVEAGGAFDIEGGTVSGPVTANKAARLLLCGATISGPVVATNGTGPVVIGGPGCPGNTIAGPVTVTGNTAGVLIEGNVIKGPLTVTGNEGGTTVTNNTVFGPLTVTGNTGVVIDKPNVVMGPSKLQ